MNLKKNQNSFVSFTKGFVAFSLTEALLAVVLVGIVSALAIGALNVSGQIQGLQSNKVVQSAMMEVQSAFTKFKRRNGMLDETTISALGFTLLDGRTITTALELDGNTPANTITCNAGGLLCIQLKSGAVVAFLGATTFGASNLFTPRNIRVTQITIDPDGVNSTPTNAAGQSVKLLFSMQGHFLTSTAWQFTQLAPAAIVVQQPRYFRLDT